MLRGAGRGKKTSPVLSVANVTIQSSKEQPTNSTQPFPSALPSQVDLNFHEAIPSSRSSSRTTAIISPQDLTVFTTDSHQSPWLPSSSPSLPAPPAHQQPYQQPQHQQDFVLFDQPSPARTTANRTVSSPATAANTNFGSLNNNRRHSSSHQVNNSSDYSPSLQNQRVAQIIQATGHQTSSLAFNNRLNSPTAQNQNQQFYASLSAPSSTIAVNQQQQHRQARPPVPLFTQGIGNQNPAKMDLQGKHIPSSARRANRLHNADALGDLTWGEGGVATPAYSSPAAAYDFGVSSASSSTTNIGTVSPHDLLISAPNSTAFTNLTSPSFSNESPDFIDSFDVSPNFGSNDFDTGASDPWYPLFPQETTVTDTFPTPALDDSPIDKSEDLEVVEPAPLPRRKSANSPTSHGRHSSVSGVNSRRRDKPLPPIIVDDPSDNIAMKRARNTLAARKSRERKAQRFDELEEKIAKLEQERDHWKRIAMSRTGGS
ncbi:Cross-pathway control 1 [Apiospora aurea]|uniref:Cross-pathway control 1 n=1 Tax=Apiospora aurea TaxID=335848 RepID=A0ABR1PYT4_9PEZI